MVCYKGGLKQKPAWKQSTACKLFGDSRRHGSLSTAIRYPYLHQRVSSQSLSKITALFAFHFDRKVYTVATVVHVAVFNSDKLDKVMPLYSQNFRTDMWFRKDQGEERGLLGFRPQFLSQTQL